MWLFCCCLGRDVELLIPITILEDPVCIHCTEFLTIFDVAKLTTVICTKCGKENSIPSELPQIQNSILDEEKTPLVAKIKESTKKIEKAFQKMTSKTGPPSSIEMSDTKPESKSRNNSEQQPVVTEISSKLDNPTPPIEPKKFRNQIQNHRVLKNQLQLLLHPPNQFYLKSVSKVKRKSKLRNYPRIWNHQNKKMNRFLKLKRKIIRNCQPLIFKFY